MTNQRFGRWTRLWAADHSRRRFLRLLGGALAALLTLVGGEEVEAACARVGQRCERSRHCCPGARCRHGTCRCKAGFSHCGGGGCIDVQRCGNTCASIAEDRNNCGRCGHRCPEGTSPFSSGVLTASKCDAGTCCSRVYNTCGPAVSPCCATGLEAGARCVSRANGTSICCGPETYYCAADCQPGGPCDACCSGSCGLNGNCEV